MSRESNRRQHCKEGVEGEVARDDAKTEHNPPILVPVGRPHGGQKKSNQTKPKKFPMSTNKWCACKIQSQNGFRHRNLRLSRYWSPTTIPLLVE